MQFILFVLQYMCTEDKMEESTNTNTQDVPLYKDDQLLDTEKILTDEEVWKFVAMLQNWQVEA